MTDWGTHVSHRLAAWHRLASPVRTRRACQGPERPKQPGLSFSSNSPSPVGRNALLRRVVTWAFAAEPESCIAALELCTKRRGYHKLCEQSLARGQPSSGFQRRRRLSPTSPLPDLPGGMQPPTPQVSPASVGTTAVLRSATSGRGCARLLGSLRLTRLRCVIRALVIRTEPEELLPILRRTDLRQPLPFHGHVHHSNVEDIIFAPMT
jgi:hypothetical protein